MKACEINIRYEDLEKVDLSPAEQQLCGEATQATDKAYAPYSQFFVGAAARLTSGKLVASSNLENAAYPQCLCAEAVLLGTLHAKHGAEKIEAIAVAVRSALSPKAVAAPCGSCRQQLFEAEQRNGSPISLYLAKAEGGALRFPSVATILPFGFKF